VKLLAKGLEALSKAARKEKPKGKTSPAKTAKGSKSPKAPSSKPKRPSTSTPIKSTSGRSPSKKGSTPKQSKKSTPSKIKHDAEQPVKKKKMSKEEWEKVRQEPLPRYILPADVRT